MNRRVTSAMGKRKMRPAISPLERVVIKRAMQITSIMIRIPSAAPNIQRDTTRLRGPVGSCRMLMNYPNAGT